MRATAILANACLGRGQRGRRLRASGERCLGLAALCRAELVNLGKSGLKLRVVHHLLSPALNRNMS